MDEEIGDFSVHIVGLGLMGGSMAMALRDHAHQITAQDLRPDVLQIALKRGVIDAIGGIEQANVVILAVPADRMTQVLEQIIPSLKTNTILMDIGSTKGKICDSLDQLPEHIQAVGGHPMCGLAENGFQNAIPTLYRNARFVLCETKRTTPHAKKVAEKVAEACGALPVWLDRYRHDYLTGLTSHLPHLLNFALMRLAIDVSTENNDLFQLAAGGFDGATRLARTNESMITGMFTTNAQNIRELTARFREQLDLLDTLFDNPTQLNDELQRIVEARRYYSDNYGERPIA
jgi:prephenate dehydrogenase